MIFIGGFGAFGGGGKRVLKPHGGSMRLIENPLGVLGLDERKMLDAKRGILESHLKLESFQAAVNLKQLTDRIHLALNQMFPNAGSILLGRKNSDYLVLSYQGLEFDPNLLNFSAKNSIVRAAGEGKPIERRTIFISDLSAKGIYLASEFDTVVEGGLETNKHQLEEGTINKCGLSFDLISLKRSKVKAIAVAPVLEFKRMDPVGAVVLVGERGFLNPLLDLIVLRELADQIAKPLRSKIS